VSANSLPGHARSPWLMLRVLVCAVVLAASAVVLRGAMSMRNFEAWLSGHVISALARIKAGSGVNSPIVWFADGPHRYMGLFISGECTVDALIVPFMVSSAWVIWRQARVLRPVLGLVIAVGLLLGMNQFRLLLIVVFTVHLGYGSGFYWGHTIIGSLITVFGLVLVFLIYVLVVTPGMHAHRRREDKADKPAAEELAN
jgi:exosortase/archaeosortase family protein